MIVLFITLNYLDVITTLRAIGKGLKEINPLVWLVHNKFGLKGLLLFKTISVLGFIGTTFFYSFNILVIIILIYALVVANNIGAICHART